MPYKSDKPKSPQVTDKKKIQEIFEQITEEGLDNDFTESVSKFYEKYGYITERQYDALENILNQDDEMSDPYDPYNY